MLVVRNCFIAKPGNASKLAAQLKEAAAVAKIPNHRVLTDLTGEFNRVILEFQVDNVGGFEARLNDYATNPAFREKMKGYTDLWTTGSRDSPNSLESRLRLSCVPSAPKVRLRLGREPKLSSVIVECCSSVLTRGRISIRGRTIKGCPFGGSGLNVRFSPLPESAL
jgi:hypothetical protein